MTKDELIRLIREYGNSSWATGYYDGKGRYKNLMQDATYLREKAFVALFEAVYKES